MSDVAIGGSPVRPAVVEVLPDAEVEALVDHKEAELGALRRELADALNTAERAERRCNEHSAAAFFDDAFEDDVLAAVARRTFEATRSPSSARDPVASVADRLEPSREVSPAPGEQRPAANGHDSGATVPTDRPAGLRALPSPPPSVVPTGPPPDTAASGAVGSLAAFKDSVATTPLWPAVDQPEAAQTPLALSFASMLESELSDPTRPSTQFGGEGEFDVLRRHIREALTAVDRAERHLNALATVPIADGAFRVDTHSNGAATVSEAMHAPGLAPPTGNGVGSPPDEPRPGAGEHTPHQPATNGNGSRPTNTDVVAPPPSTRASFGPAPRTVVVTRPRPSTGTVESSLPPSAFDDPGAPTVQTRAVAASGVMSPVRAPSPTSDPRPDPPTTSEPSRVLTQARWMATIPPRLFIQTGVAVVIIALLLLKLG